MGKRKMGPLVCVDVKTILALLYYKNLAHVCPLGEQKQQTDSPPSVLLFHTGFSSFTSSSSNLSDSTWSQSWLHLRAVCKKKDLIAYRQQLFSWYTATRFARSGAGHVAPYSLSTKSVLNKRYPFVNCKFFAQLESSRRRNDLTRVSRVLAVAVRIAELLSCL